MTDVWAVDQRAHRSTGWPQHLGREVNEDTVEGATLAMVEYGRTRHRRCSS